MFAKLRSNETLFVLIDQAVVSGGNFLTTLVLARTLAPAHYGVFSLILLFLYAINTCHSSLVVYPLTLRAAKGKPDTLAGDTASALLQTVCVALPLAIACVIFAVAIHQIQLIVMLVLAMTAWQLQETTRRALLASHNAGKAINSDALCFLGQGLILLIVRPQSVTAILLTIVITSCAALLWQAITLQLRPHSFRQGTTLREAMSHSWKLGRSILGGNLFNMLALQLPSWSLAYFAGPVGVAGYQSILNLAGVANPIIFSVNTALIPAVARSADKGFQQARRTALRLGVQYGVLLLPLFLALAIAPLRVMRLMYGSSSPYVALAGLLPIFIAAYTLQYVATVIGAYEGGMSRPQTYLYVQAVSTVALAALCVPLTRTYGVRGTVAAVVGFSVFRLISFTCFSVAADRKTPGNTTRAMQDDSKRELKVTSKIKKVTVCILTYRRPTQLSATLRSLVAQDLLKNERYSVEVIVVDNDEAKSAQGNVKLAADSATIPIRYITNPKNGLSTGRNIALGHASDADYVALIDDDETAPSGWLSALLETAEQEGSDVVTGPVFPEFVDAPAWIQNGGFFKPSVRPTGSAVQHVATNNTLLRSNICASFRFNVKFDRTGGEDTDFFLRVGAAGHKMTWCNEAPVREVVPPARANSQWIVSRAKSDANRFTHAYLGLHQGLSAKLMRVAKSAGGVLAGAMLLPLSIFGRRHHVRSMSYFARSAGTMAALQGRQRADYAGVLTASRSSITHPLPIVVVGQTPPPLNGQTIMIRQFVTGTYDDIAITYVPMRFSRTTAEIGRFDLRKIWITLATIGAILSARFRSGSSVLYYPPAGANLAPVLRDLVILNVCRPFFRQVVFHFHAAGLSKIYSRLPVILRVFFRAAYNEPDLAIFTTAATSQEADALHAKQVAIVPCGIADCEPQQHSRPISDRPTLLFAGILCEGKGVMTLLRAASELKAAGVSFHLQLMGAFQTETFEAKCRAFVWDQGLSDQVTWSGVLSGAEKANAFSNAEVFCFPSHYPAESFGVVLIEAMSYSLPIVATDWQGIPEVTGRDGHGALLVPVRNEHLLALSIKQCLDSRDQRTSMGKYNRALYLERYTIDCYRHHLSSSLAALRAA